MTEAPLLNLITQADAIHCEDRELVEWRGRFWRQAIQNQCRLDVFLDELREERALASAREALL